MSDVKIVKLESMFVASVQAYSEHPEEDAWKKLETWSKPRGLFDDNARIFGFNNPNPSAGSTKYGYEFWICVDEGTEPEGGVSLRRFEGGLYAVGP